MNETRTDKGPDVSEAARSRLAATGRNELCPCGSGKKYKKCHLAEDEGSSIAAPAAPDPDAMLAAGWRLFEQRRPGAAEKEFRSALSIRPDWAEALAGIGLAKLQSGDNEAAREEFRHVQRASTTLADGLRASGAKDAFTRKEAQAYIRSCHALGCLAFDEKKYDDALVELERVYAIDEGPVGTEARLIAGVALIKLGRSEEAARVLEVAAASEAGGSRAPMSLALAHFLSGNNGAAEAALEKALIGNAALGKVLLGRVAKRVANFGAAAPGSRDEAFGYVQTYGDAWDASAKRFLEDYLDKRAANTKNVSADQTTRKTE